MSLIVNVLTAEKINFNLKSHEINYYVLTALIASFDLLPWFASLPLHPLEISQTQFSVQRCRCLFACALRSLVGAKDHRGPWHPSLTLFH